jgi:DNA-binding NarL/FixJ family response regulator
MKADYETIYVRWRVMPNPMDVSAVQRPEAPIRVYLVEDSPSIRALILEDFAAIPGIAVMGYSETESDALNTLSRESFDVIIFDIQLQQGNGINLLRALAQNEKRSTALKVVFSNHVGATYRRLCEQYGVRYFFDKTCEFAGLRGMMARMGAEELS